MSGVMDKGRAGSPRAGCLPLAELGVLLLRHVFMLSRKSKAISERPSKERTTRIFVTQGPVHAIISSRP